MEQQVEVWRLLFESRGLPMFQAAYDALVEFGGLQVTAEDTPEGMTGSNSSFELNPEWVEGLEWVGIECGMYPIGKVSLGDTVACWLFIDEQGWIHMTEGGREWFRLWGEDDAFPVAPSLREALGCFIRGRANLYRYE